MAKTYYIFRHGLTFAVKTGTAYGDSILTAPIIDEGKKAIEKMGQFLKDKQTDFNVSSPIKRCKQTSGIISEITGKEFIFDERLTEFYMEQQTSLECRLKSLLAQIDERGYQKIAVCTHGAVISILIGILTAEKTSGQYDIYHYPDPGVLVVISGGNVEEINFNFLTKSMRIY